MASPVATASQPATEPIGSPSLIGAHEPIQQKNVVDSSSMDSHALTPVVPTAQSQSNAAALSALPRMSLQNNPNEKTQFDAEERKRFDQTAKEDRAIAEARVAEEAEHAKAAAKLAAKHKPSPSLSKPLPSLPAAAATTGASLASHQQQQQHPTTSPAQPRRSLVTPVIVPATPQPHTAEYHPHSGNSSTAAAAVATTAVASHAAPPRRFDSNASDSGIANSLCGIPVAPISSWHFPHRHAEHWQRETQQQQQLAHLSGIKYANAEDEQKHFNAITLHQYRHWNRHNACVQALWLLWALVLFCFIVSLVYLGRQSHYASKNDVQHSMSLAGNITEGSVSSYFLGTNAVTNDKLATGAVSTRNLQARSVTTQQLAQDVTSLLGNLSAIDAQLLRTQRQNGTGLLLTNDTTLSVRLDPSSLTVDPQTQNIGVRGLKFAPDGSLTLSGVKPSGLLRLDSPVQITSSAMDVTPLLYTGLSNETVYINDTDSYQQEVTTTLVRPLLVDFASLNTSLLTLSGAPGRPVPIQVTNCDAAHSGMRLTLANNMSDPYVDSIQLSQSTCSELNSMQIFPGQFVELHCVPTAQMIDGTSVNCLRNDAIASGGAKGHVGVGNIGYAFNQTTAGSNASVTIDAYSGLLELTAREALSQFRYVSFTMYNRRITSEHSALILTPVKVPSLDDALQVQLNVAQQYVRPGQATIVLYLSGSFIAAESADAQPTVFHFSLV